MKGLLNKPRFSVERVTARYQQQYVERLSYANTFNLYLLHGMQAFARLRIRSRPDGLEVWEVFLPDDLFVPVHSRVE